MKKVNNETTSPFFQVAWLVGMHVSMRSRRCFGYLAIGFAHLAGNRIVTILFDLSKLVKVGC